MRRALLLLLALVLVPASAAEAKFSTARICGASDCTRITLASGRQLTAMEEIAWRAESQLGAKPPAAARWYRVTLCPGRCDSNDALALKVLPGVGYAYLPPASWDHVVGGTYPPRNGWARIARRDVGAYRAATAGLNPFPASRLVALGPGEPRSGAGQGASPGGTSVNSGIPVWGWIVIAAAVAAAALAFASRRRLRRSPRSPSTG